MEGPSKPKNLDFQHEMVNHIDYYIDPSTEAKTSSQNINMEDDKTKV